jgi:gamma-glutamyltranspeptidase
MELALKIRVTETAWAQLIEPARRLAADGFTVTYSLSRSLQSNKDYLSKYQRQEDHLKGGKFYEGEIFRHRNYATLLGYSKRAK